MLCRLCQTLSESIFDYYTDDRAQKVSELRSLKDFATGIAEKCLLCCSLLALKEPPASSGLNAAQIKALSRACQKALDNDCDVKVKINPYTPKRHLMRGIADDEVRAASILFEFWIPAHILTCDESSSDSADDTDEESAVQNTSAHIWISRVDQIAWKRHDSRLPESIAPPRALVVAQLRSWLKDDMAEEIATTSPLEMVEAYPKRLVRLTDLRHDVFYIENTAGWSSGRAFAALSYLWGTSSNFKCLRENLAGLQNGQKLEILDKNISQAMQLTLDIGIEYIWIDRLCIIQDDPADRDAELAQMGSIYSTAQLTLALHIEPSSDRSLLETLLSRIQELDPRDRYSTDTTVVGLPISPRNEIAWGSISRRAWCFQERLLAKRVAHIKSNTVVWEGNCNEKESVCDFQYPWKSYDVQSRLPGTSSIASRRDVARLKAIIDDGPMPGKRTALRGTFLNTWARFVQDYSKRSLSFNEDKLVAMSAINKRLQENTGYAYTHGIWIELLPFCLNWITSFGPQNPLPAAGSLVLPSWTWARWSEWIHCRFEDTSRSISGSLTSAVFAIDAQRLPVLYMQGKLLGPFHSNVYGQDHSETLDRCLIDIFQELGLHCGSQPEMFHYVNWDGMVQDGPAVTLEQTWYTPIITIYSDNGSRVSEKFVIGLILQRPCAARNEFERVGILESGIIDEHGEYTKLVRDVATGSATEKQFFESFVFENTTSFILR